jgi:transposase
MKAIKPYEEEFKKRAVELLRSSGKPAVQIARELGCTADSLRTWKRKYDNPLEGCLNPDELTPAELKRENARLQKELNYVTEQRDILKKVAAILGH